VIGYNDRVGMDKGAGIFGLHKIPDKKLISILLIERGKNLAYIEELEEELGKNCKNGICAKCEAKNALIKALEKKNKKLESKESTEEETFKKRYYDLLKKYERMEKQMIEIAKSSINLS
jgi:predicted nuclease with TOPRIM domain